MARSLMSWSNCRLSIIRVEARDAEHVGYLGRRDVERHDGQHVVVAEAEAIANSLLEDFPQIHLTPPDIEVGLKGAEEWQGVDGDCLIETTEDVGSEAR